MKSNGLHLSPLMSAELVSTCDLNSEEGSILIFFGGTDVVRRSRKVSHIYAAVPNNGPNSISYMWSAPHMRSTSRQQQTGEGWPPVFPVRTDEYVIFSVQSTLTRSVVGCFSRSAEHLPRRRVSASERDWAYWAGLGQRKGSR